MTIKQFLYLLIPVMAFLFMFFTKTSLMYIVLSETVLIPYALASAFVMINGQKFNAVFVSFIIYGFREKMYLWHKIPRVKIFPEVNISLFHKTVEKTDGEELIAKKIQDIAHKID